MADSKIVDRGNDATTLFVNAGADWVTVMAGTSRVVIHETCATAHSFGKRVLLDLLDAPAIGQSALEAKALGVDALLFHQPHDEKEPFCVARKMGNGQRKFRTANSYFGKNRPRKHTRYFAAPPRCRCHRANNILAENPAAEAKYFADIIKKHQQFKD